LVRVVRFVEMPRGAEHAREYAGQRRSHDRPAPGVEAQRSGAQMREHCRHSEWKWIDDGVHCAHQC